MSSGGLSLLYEILNQSWRDRAKCRGKGPRMFFPDEARVGQTQHVRDAKDFCADCPAKTPCLEWAVQAGEKFGVWGGASERDRRKISSRRRKTG